MSWSFYNATYDIDDADTCGLTLLDAAAVPDSFTIQSSFVLVSPNVAWKPFNPSDNYRIQTQGDTSVGYRRQLFKVSKKKLVPIYWDLNVSTAVVKADWVFSTTQTPLPPAWELVASALVHKVKPWTEEYKTTFENAQQTGNIDDISAKITIDNYTGRILFSPSPKEQQRGHILSLYQSKSAKFISDWGSKFGQTIEISRFDYDEYKKRLKVPDRPSDKIDYEPESITNLTLVVHGIGQKLSVPMEKRNFTFAVEKLRTRVRKEYESQGKRDDTFMLPVIWRHAFKVENAHVTPDQIRPPFMTELRDKFNDFMYDIPYYMSSHRDIMIKATSKEANRVYSTFLTEHPYFDGPVNMIGHSLGSVIAADILSSQDTVSNKDSPLMFNVDTFFTAGSPLGFFLYLRTAQLIPRSRWEGPLPEFGCLAVKQIYNIVNPYDIVASLISPTVRGGCEGLEPALLPRTYGERRQSRSKLDLITSRFHKQAEEKQAFEPSEDMLALNVNGQLDWIIQASSRIELVGALTAHTNYWVNSDFARLLVHVGKRPELQAMKKTD